MKNKDYQKIRYSQCWEDATIVLNALNIQKDDIVLSIGSGGCNSFSIMSKNPEKIYIVDNNFAQIALISLKLQAIKLLEYNCLLEFLGIKKSSNRIFYFENIKNDLPKDVFELWDVNHNYLKKGIIHSGNFEKYLNFFRKFVLPLIQSDKNKRFILNCKDKNYQKNFYENKWQNFRWKLIFKIFFSKKIMRKRGRSKEMFQFEQNTSSGEIFFKRFENGLKLGNVFENEYLEYILFGNYFNNFPEYLQKSNIEIIKLFANYEIVQNNLLDFLKQMPENSISKFNLSDIFEALPIEVSDRLFSEIFRTAKHNSLIIFWNNLVYRNIPDILTKYFIFEENAIEDLKPIDKIFFYEKFYIYKIIKNLL